MHRLLQADGGPICLADLVTGVIVLAGTFAAAVLATRWLLAAV